MKIKITEDQLNLILKEQKDPLEKTLSSLDYATNKPFSCVEYEPIKINGKDVFPKNFRKTVQYMKSTEDGEKKFGINVSFFKEYQHTPLDYVVLKIFGLDDGKRYQQLEYQGSFKCQGRVIKITLNDVNYYQAAENGSMKENDLIKQTSPFTPNPFSGTIPLNNYNSLDALGAEISKITFDHNSLNNII